MLTPLPRYSGANYPTKDQILLHPELLKTVPRRWARNPVVLTALSLVLSAGLTACGTASESILPDSNSAPAASDASGASNSSSSGNSTISAASAEDSSQDSTENSTNDPATLDIPIFAHGTGRGSYGCESVAPPVFLSEEEAMQVIEEECAAQGIDLSGQKTISGTFPATSTLPEAISGGASDQTYTGDLRLDGYSEDLGIGVEFVSTDDILDWKSDTGMAATVEEFDLKGTAQRLADCTDNVAVFYDPTADDYNDFTGSNEESYVESSKEQSLEDLRAQVRDFLQWLKAQGGDLMHFTLHLTDACNLRCRYCYVHQSNHYMTLDTAKAVVDLAAEDPGHHGLIFFGGEPLLQRQLIYDTVAYAQSLHLPGKFHYKITTNGTLLDQEFLDFSRENQVFIALSHDGIAQDINRIGPEDSGTFDALEPIAKSLLAARPYAPVMMTVAPNTVRFYAQGVKYLYDLGFRYLICTIDYSGDWQESDFRELERQYRLLAKWYENLTLREEKFYFSPFEVKISSHIHRSTYCTERCELGKKQLSVAPDGGLYPCVQFVGHPEYQIGDVFHGIDQAKRQQLYAENEETHGPCRDCAIKNRCNHHCACLNFQSTGDFHQVSPVLCRHERIVLPIADRLAQRLYQKRSGAFLQKQYNDMYPVISYVEDTVKK